MSQVLLSGFADEISPDLEEQLDTLATEGIKHIEFRGVWNKGVMTLTDNELDKVKAALDKRGFKISSIGSPIGKVPIDADFEEHLVSFRRAIAIAKKLQAPYIRLFSFYLPKDQNPLQYRDEVMRRVKGLVDAAAGSGLILLHENEADIYGMPSDRCLDILQTVNSPTLRAAFDFANFVHAGEYPNDKAFARLRPYIEYIHVKDMLMAEQRVVPAGEGDGQVKEILKELLGSGWTGFLSLEPHLAHAGQFRGFSGPENFRRAAQALKKILNELGVSYA